MSYPIVFVISLVAVPLLVIFLLLTLLKRGRTQRTPAPTTGAAVAGVYGWAQSHPILVLLIGGASLVALGLAHNALELKWQTSVACAILIGGALYTIYRYFQKSDGKLAAAVGGWLVIGGAILAVFYLILGDNLSTKLIVTGLEGTRSMLDPVARDGGGATSVTAPTILKMTGGDGTAKRFEVAAAPVEVVVPNGTRTVTLCLRPVGADLAAVTRNPAPTFSHEAISGGRQYTPAPHVVEIYRGKKMPVEVRLNGGC